MNDERLFLSVPCRTVPPGTPREPGHLLIGNTVIRACDLREALQRAYLERKKPAPVEDRLERSG